MGELVSGSAAIPSPCGLSYPVAWSVPLLLGCQLSAVNDAGNRAMGKCSRVAGQSSPAYPTNHGTQHRGPPGALGSINPSELVVPAVWYLGTIARSTRRPVIYRLESGATCYRTQGVGDSPEYDVLDARVIIVPSGDLQ